MKNNKMVGEIKSPSIPVCDSCPNNPLAEVRVEYVSHWAEIDPNRSVKPNLGTAAD